jgi:glucose-1-phosphate cytidylyltransferase
MTSFDDITVVALCGGKGERLRPFTDKLPKPLVELNDRPLLEHLLGLLAAAGLRRFVLCTGYKGAAIEDFVKAHPNPAWGEVTCVDSGEDASMTDRVLSARPLVKGRALICYGDTIANVDIAGLVRTHVASGVLATVTVYPLRSSFGVVSFDEQARVTRFDEKPELPYWINIGFVMCEPAALDRLEPGKDLVSYLRSLCPDGSLGAYRHTGKHLTVNTEKERAEAEREIEFFTVMEGKTS